MIAELRQINRSPFHPTLLASEVLEVSQEQRDYIREVLEIASSDVQFAEKAYAAIVYILTAGKAVAPEVTSLTPSTVVIGAPSFDIHVIGSNFDENSVILFNGLPEPTVLVSPTELTTGVNMPLWLAPAIVPVSVQSGEGVISESMDFEFTAV